MTDVVPAVAPGRYYPGNVAGGTQVGAPSGAVLRDARSGLLRVAPTKGGGFKRQSEVVKAEPRKKSCVETTKQGAACRGRVVEGEDVCIGHLNARNARRE